MSATMMVRDVALLASMVLTLCRAAPARAQGENRPQERGQSASHPAAVQTETAAPPSLAELARRQRADHAEASGKPVKTYTNDNLPKGGDITILASPQHPAAEANGNVASAQGNHGEEYYRARAQELQSRLEIHQRELDVLQQELGENQVQYYSNPSEALQQQYSRADIGGVRAAIEKKQQQVDRDQQAVSNLEADLRGEGGDPGWLEGQASQTVTAKPDLSGVAKGSEEYWRRRFSAAREALAWAQEQRQLAEDELRLLQSQQAHDWGSAAAESAESRIADKQTEVESKSAAEAQAQRELDALESEFRQSGAPEDWSTPAPVDPSMSDSPQNPTR